MPPLEFVQNGWEVPGRVRGPCSTEVVRGGGCRNLCSASFSLRKSPILRLSRYSCVRPHFFCLRGWPPFLCSRSCFRQFPGARVLIHFRTHRHRHSHSHTDNSGPGFHATYTTEWPCKGCAGAGKSSLGNALLFRETAFRSGAAPFIIKNNVGTKNRPKKSRTIKHCEISRWVGFVRRSFNTDTIETRFLNAMQKYVTCA